MTGEGKANPAEWILWTLPLAAALALGSVPVWTLGPLAFLSATSLGFIIWRLKRSGKRLWIPAITWAFLCGLAVCCLQLIPLPPTLLAWASPRAAEVRAFALVPLKIFDWKPISLDAPSTWRELSKHLTYVIAFLATVQLSRQEKARDRLLAAVALAGAVIALIGHAHAFLNLQKLFGWFSYREANPPFLSTFGNPNNLAGFLSLSATLSLGLACSVESRLATALWTLAYVTTGSAVLMSLSRAGIAFFALGHLAMLAVMLARRAPQRRILIVGVAGVVGVLGLAAFVASETLWVEFQSIDSLEKIRNSKVALWPVFFHAGRAFARLGMGRGTFEIGFTPFNTFLPGTLFTHPENIFLQLFAEEGALFTALTIGLFAWGIRASIKPLRELGTLETATLVGLGVLLLQNCFDFGLEYPACALSASVSLGTLCRAERYKIPRKPGWILWATATCLSALALAVGMPSHHRFEERLAKAYQAGTPANQLEQLARPMLRRHPADYYLYSLLGTAFSSGAHPKPVQALEYVNRALLLNPLDGNAHLAAARALLTLQQRMHAFLEYRWAYQYSSAPEVINEALAAVKDDDELHQLIPHLLSLAEKMSERLWLTGRHLESCEVLEIALNDTQDDPVTRVRLAGCFNQLGQGDRALQALSKLEKWAEQDEHFILTKAESLNVSHRNDQALAELQSGRDRFPSNSSLALALAQQLLLVGQPQKAREILSNIEPWVSQAGTRSVLFALRGESYEREGQRVKALDLYQLAARTQPSAGLFYRVASLYESLHELQNALGAVREGQKLDTPAGAKTAADWISRLEAAQQQLRAAREEDLIVKDAPAP